MKDKRPVRYVARRIIGHENFGDRLIAVFVARAYLMHMEKYWSKDGISGETYSVEFCDDGFAWGEWVDTNLSVEYPETRVDCVFKDYDSCKKYVDELNKSNFEYKLHNAQNKKEYSEIVSNYNTAIAFGNAMEEKYIPAEERQNLVYQSTGGEEFIK